METTHFLQMENDFYSNEYVDSIVEWMRKNWFQSVYYSIIYIILIFGIQAYMKNRKPFDLRLALSLWNVFLAMFSIIGTFKTAPTYTNRIINEGVASVICDKSFGYGSTGFWSFVFCISKFPELIDTLFIVLRKKPLIFLHWYHHTTVMVYCWYSYHDLSSNGGAFVCMNFAVHSIMYAYYALKEFKFYIPKWCAQIITFTQLSQMVVGCYVNGYAWYLKNHDYSCGTSYENIYVSFLMYFSYFLLFAHFFINAYFTKKPAANDKSATSSGKTKAN